MEERENNKYNKLIFHHSFNDTIAEINKLKIWIPPNPTPEEMDFQLYVYPMNGKLVTNIENFNKCKLDAEKGKELLDDNILITAYDESINKFSGLEGTAYLTSHSIVIDSKKEYIPLSFLTFYFYTRSKTYTEKTKFITYSDDPDVDSKRDYIRDRTKFIINNIPKNSIIFIDGPLIGGQHSDKTRKMNDELLKRDIIPIFFVKNSSSNLVTDYTMDLKGKYNSDMHWAYEMLKPGERTSFFQYVDENNPHNAKLFCYVKAFDLSPHRIEFHLNTFEKYGGILKDIMNLSYYLLLAQGNMKNPQVRTIAVAEKYARSTIKLINITTLMKSLGITSTMNQERFGW